MAQFPDNRFIDAMFKKTDDAHAHGKIQKNDIAFTVLHMLVERPKGFCPEVVLNENGNLEQVLKLFLDGKSLPAQAAGKNKPALILHEARHSQAYSNDLVPPYRFVIQKQDDFLFDEIQYVQLQQVPVNRESPHGQDK